MKEIILSNTGNKALVDDDDFEKVVSFGKWYENDNGYAVKKTRIRGANKSIRMHILVNDTPKGWHTDHINGNRIDNRKSNLRTVTAALNNWNRHVDKDHHVYSDLPKGVSYDKSRSKYVASYTQRKRFNDLKDAINFTKGEI